MFSVFAGAINRLLKLAGYLFLLIILLLQAGGMLLIYKMQQYYVQVEMRQSLTNDKTRFQKIVLSFNDYKKCKINPDEITVKNKMYDVKSITFSGNNVELLVLNDVKEENILKKIQDYVANTKLPNGDFLNNLKQLLSLSYLFQEAYCNFVIYPSSINNFPLSGKNILSTFPEIPSPPPRLS